jgi:hypothetical protein
MWTPILIWRADLVINKASFDSRCQTQRLLEWDGTALDRRVDNAADGLVIVVV